MELTPSGAAAAAKAKTSPTFVLNPKILTVPQNKHFATTKCLTLSRAYLEIEESNSLLALPNPFLLFSLVSAA